MSACRRYPTPAKTYYMDATNGSDTNLGTSTAWQTLAKINATTLKDGDRIVMTGTWSGTTSLTVPNSGKPGRRIVFIGTGTCIINRTTNYGIRTNSKSYLEFVNIDGTSGTRNYYVYDSVGVLIRDCDVLGTTADEGCIVIEASADNITSDITILRVTSTAQPGWMVSVGSGIAFQQRNITVKDCTITSIAGGGAVQHHGIYAKNCNLLIDGCVITDAWNGAIKLVQAAGKTISGRIRRCTLTGYGAGGSGSGISLDAVTGQLIIENNVIAFGLYLAGIYSLSRSDNIEVYNNTIVESYYGIELLTGATGWIVKGNNIMQDAAWLASSYRSCIKLAAEADIANNTFDYNNYRHKNGAGTYDPIRKDGSNPISLATWQGLGGDPNGLSVDPVFVTAYSNLHLQSGSTLRGAGVAITGILADRDGVPLDASPDIGAYQYTA